MPQRRGVEGHREDDRVAAAGESMLRIRYTLVAEPGMLPPMVEHAAAPAVTSAPGERAYHPASAWASSPSRILRRAAKRSEAAGGIVEPLTDVIRANGFCGTRFGHVRAWTTSDSLRSAPHWRQR